MKKPVSKLSLNRETVRRLEPAALARAAGGTQKSVGCILHVTFFPICVVTMACGEPIGGVSLNNDCL